MMPAAMQLFVTYVIDGESFRVNPEWRMFGERGEIVQIRGHEAPGIDHPGGLAFKERLEELVLHRSVELVNMVRIAPDVIEADVYISGQSIAEQMTHG
jgi:hypothetical protein